MNTQFPTPYNFEGLGTANGKPMTASAPALFARYGSHDIAMLEELLSACIGDTAGERARTLARIAETGISDPAACHGIVRRMRDDLLALPMDVSPVAPDRLVRVRPTDLDAALRYHLGRLSTLANLLEAARGS